MAITISNAYIETFEANIRQLAQQGTTRLRPFVSEVFDQSEKHNWDRLAASAAVQKTSARVATPMGGSGAGGAGSVAGLTWSRRRTLTETWHTGEAVEKEDPSQMLADPNSAVTRNLAMNMRRAVDDVVIAAATGNATDGAGAAVVFPAGQGIGSAVQLWTQDLVLSATELFMSNDVDPDEPKVIVIGPTQQHAMLNIDTVTNSNYQTVKALSSGVLPSYLGYTWVVSNRLTIPAAGELYCLAFTKKALGLHISRDIWARVTERSDLSYAWQLYSAMSLACVRVEDEHIVRIHVKDALV